MSLPVDPKARLTVTVDPQWIRAGREAVSARRSASISAWVNQALAERAAKDQRLRALGEAIAAYEAQFGLITEEEMTAQARRDRAGAKVIRGGRPSRRIGRRERPA